MLAAAAVKSDAVGDRVMRITASFLLVTRPSVIDGVQPHDRFQINAPTG
jgi:hypothetical protein